MIAFRTTPMLLSKIAYRSSSYKPLLLRLLESQREEMTQLVDQLAMMKHTWDNPYGLIDEDLREHRRVERFYKNLNPQMPISYLQKIEDIVLAPIVITKRIFYHNYANRHAASIIKHAPDAVWLYERCILSTTDQADIGPILEQHLVSAKPVLQKASLQRLFNLYLLKGRVHPQVYKEYLRPFIMRTKMSEVSGIIQAIKFVVCSECEDTQLLKTLYQSLEFHSERLSRSRDMYDLHLITHYLRVKGYTIRLPALLEKELTQFCTQRSQGRETMSKIVQDMHKGKDKWVSECLNTRKSALRQFDSTARSQFQSRFWSQLTQLQLKEMKIYEKPVFCCFELDFCLRKEGSNQLCNIEVGGVQYVFSSGRMVRMREIRDSILQHYGFKVNHIDCNTFHATRPHPMELMQPRKAFFSRK